MTGGLWFLATIVGPVVLGFFIYFGLRQSEKFSQNRAAVERQQRGVRASYGGDEREPPVMPAPMHSQRPQLVAMSIAVVLALALAMTWMLARSASDRAEPLQGANNETGTQTLPVTQPNAQRSGCEPACKIDPCLGVIGAQI